MSRPRRPRKHGLTPAWFQFVVGGPWHACGAFLLPGIPVHLRAEKPELLLGDSVGARLKRRRLELGLKQVDVAERLRVSEFTVLGWEVSGREPEDRHYPAIIEFLGYEPWPAPQTIGERVRAERLRRGLSAKAAAKEIGVDEESVRMWEADAWRPTSRTFTKIADFLTSASPAATAELRALTR